MYCCLWRELYSLLCYKHFRFVNHPHLVLTILFLIFFWVEAVLTSFEPIMSKLKPKDFLDVVS